MPKFCITLTHTTRKGAVPSGCNRCKQDVNLIIRQAWNARVSVIVSNSVCSTVCAVCIALKLCLKVCSNGPKINELLPPSIATTRSHEVVPDLRICPSAVVVANKHVDCVYAGSESL